MDELNGNINDCLLIECFDDNIKENVFHLLKNTIQKFQTININGLNYFCLFDFNGLNFNICVCLF